nr:hypothetical protein [Tanacetum cinerariifolium]
GFAMAALAGDYSGFRMDLMMVVRCRGVRAGVGDGGKGKANPHQQHHQVNSLGSDIEQPEQPPQPPFSWPQEPMAQPQQLQQHESLE